MVLIVTMGGNRNLEHYYQGEIVAVGDEAVMIKDEAMGEVAVSVDHVCAVKTLSEPPAGNPEPSSDFPIER